MSELVVGLVVGIASPTIVLAGQRVFRHTVQWEVQPWKGDLLRLTNTGKATAHHVQIQGEKIRERPGYTQLKHRLVRPGGEVIVSVNRAFGIKDETMIVAWSPFQKYPGFRRGAWSTLVPHLPNS